MGNQSSCTVRMAGKSSAGSAILETNAIIFHGDVRLKIPLASLTSVVSRDGELHLKWPAGTAVFALQDHADKWAHKILHPKRVTEKLGVKAGLVVSLVAIAQPGFAEDVRSTAKRFSQSKPIKNSDLIFFGAEAATDLARVIKLAGFLSSAGALWIVYPKGRQEIKEQQVLDTGKQAGLVDVKVVSFSPTHTALKFVVPKAKRPTHLTTRRA